MIRHDDDDDDSRHFHCSSDLLHICYVPRRLLMEDSVGLDVRCQYAGWSDVIAIIFCARFINLNIEQ